MAKRGIIIVLALFFVFVGIAYSGQREVAQIYKEAKKEGKVTLASTLREREAMPLVKAFQKDYPDIKVTYHREHGGEAMERLVREIISGAINYDVAQIHEDYMQEFMKMNAVERVNWSDFNVVPQFIHYDNHFIGVFDYPYVFVYNSNLVKKEEAPKT
jgi:ABC-type glycerol-3-phosphate transport system substrate-binding protein